MREQRCETCKWWVKPKSLQASQAECHGAPPALNAKGERTWPKTKRGDWCGAYAGTPAAEPAGGDRNE